LLELLLLDEFELELFDEFDELLLLELFDEFDELLLLELFDEFDELLLLELFDELDELLLLELFDELFDEFEDELSPEIGAAGDAGAATAAGCVAAGSPVASTTVHHTVPLPDAIPTPINGYCGLSSVARWSGELSHAATTSAGDEYPMARFSPQAVEANPDRVSRSSPVVPSEPTWVSTPVRATSSA